MVLQDLSPFAPPNCGGVAAQIRVLATGIPEEPTLYRIFMVLFVDFISY